ncbi:phage tail assembly protein [Sphingomonas oligophenolica]|uniref:Phage tail assembly protein n=1 Tax=Sphingomonas oligophenolica TaxID=301154 RepID=A0A502CRE7_9SPHN|nr:phage tail assembly protein [Sphingomonas oligophenolica]TPG14376.1 phage tail assembly protein [Sphingomonas oligophenolica]
MTDLPTADPSPTIRSFTLDWPIVVAGHEEIAAGTQIRVRKPQSGELRGLQVASLLQMDYVSLETLAPRVTTPILHKHLVAAMDPGDLTQFAGEVTDFLLPKGVREPSPQA